MLVERFAWEIGIALEDIDNDGTPSNDVALLGFFVEEDEGADYVGAETVIGNVRS